MIWIGFTVLAVAFFAVPTRVHERYLFPALVTGALLAATSIGYSDSGSGTYFGVDPKLDMIYILMAQTQNERARTRVAFKKLVYDAFAAGN